MDLARINLNVGGRPVPGYRGDEAVLAAIERDRGARMPASYVQFLRASDGGVPEIGSCRRVGADTSEPLYDIDSFYGIATPGVEHLPDVLARWRPLLGPRRLPIGRDGGGNQVVLELADEPASVWVWFTEGGAPLRLADSLEALIAALEPNPDFI